MFISVTSVLSSYIRKTVSSRQQARKAFVSAPFNFLNLHLDLLFEMSGLRYSNVKRAFIT
ncbi:hypothetical protein SC22_06095 [Bacillus sp. A053]|nr:hypothetical protein SC22_06095 [Bacillus sp. A053]